MIEKMLEEIKGKYTYKQVDVEVFANVRIEGAKINMEAYDVEDLGRVSLVRVRGFLGLWKMESFIMNPLDRDVPIYYYHRHDKRGKDLYKVELINTQLHPVELDSITAVLEKYASIPDLGSVNDWYDDMKLPGCAIRRVKKENTADLDEMAWEYFKAYMELVEKAPVCERARKKKKAAVFVDGLIEKSGLAIVQLFLAYYDHKVAKKLCNEVLFGMK